MTLLLNCLMIFFVRIVDVSLGTLSTVLVVRGKRGLGSIIGFIDIIIWFSVVKQALTIEDASFWITIAYAGGYGAGTFAGAFIEEKLAIGKSSITIITKGIRNDLVLALRDKGFGVSTILSEGKENKNLMLLVETDRKKVKNVERIINSVAPDSFITVADTSKIINGYFGRKV